MVPSRLSIVHKFRRCWRIWTTFGIFVYEWKIRPQYRLLLQTLLLQKKKQFSTKNLLLIMKEERSVLLKLIRHSNFSHVISRKVLELELQQENSQNIQLQHEIRMIMATDCVFAPDRSLPEKRRFLFSPLEPAIGFNVPRICKNFEILSTEPGCVLHRFR